MSTVEMENLSGIFIQIYSNSPYHHSEGDSNDTADFGRDNMAGRKLAYLCFLIATMNGIKCNY